MRSAIPIWDNWRRVQSPFDSLCEVTPGDAERLLDELVPCRMNYEWLTVAVEALFDGDVPTVDQRVRARTQLRRMVSDGTAAVEHVEAFELLVAYTEEAKAQCTKGLVADVRVSGFAAVHSAVFSLPADDRIAKIARTAVLDLELRDFLHAVVSMKTPTVPVFTVRCRRLGRPARPARARAGRRRRARAPVALGGDPSRPRCRRLIPGRGWA